MSNPYTPTVEPVDNSSWQLRLAGDIGLSGALVLTWLVVIYAVSLPASEMITKDSALIAIHPFIPIYLLVAVFVGETSWAMIIGIIAFPILILVMGSALGVRKKRTWLSTVALAVIYGLFLRLFYHLCNIA